MCVCVCVGGGGGRECERLPAHVFLISYSQLQIIGMCTKLKIAAHDHSLTYLLPN